VEAVIDPTLRARLKSERGFTRTHTLGEAFSALTGNPQVRFDADWSAQTIEQLIRDLDFVDLSAPEVVAALKQAKRKGVRGGHVHDLLHAAAADKSGAQDLLTIDVNDFKGLPNRVNIVSV
jgi:hypothetical protein